MRIMRASCFIFALALLAAGTATAQRGPMGQMGPNMTSPQLRGVLNPIVGSGAAYEVVDAQGMKSEMEVSIVAKEDVGGKQGYWMEMGVSSSQSGSPMYMKTLMVVDGQNASVTRMIMQPPGMAPMELPMQGMGAMQQPAATDIRDSAEKVGTESVTTPAGTFACDHYRAKDGSWDAWVAPKGHPWGLVKSTTHDATMTVTRVITNATDHITGTPQKMDPAQMMQGLGRGR